MFPESATPRDRAILFAYMEGYTTPHQIQRLYGYKTARPVEKVFQKHRHELVKLRLKRRSLIGKSFVRVV